MKLLIKRSDGLVIPHRANPSDAGYDIVATTDPIIVADKEDIVEAQPLEDRETLYRSVKYIEYGTGLFVAPEKEINHLEVFPRSSISKYQLMLANHVAVIDAPYRGEIRLRFKFVFFAKDLIFNRTRDGFELLTKVNLNAIYKKGDKIAQLMARKTDSIEFSLVDELPPSDRGAKGFGSSGA